MYIYIIFLRTHFKIYRDSYTFIPNVIEFDHIQGTYCQVGKDYIRFLKLCYDFFYALNCSVFIS